MRTVLSTALLATACAIACSLAGAPRTLAQSPAALQGGLHPAAAEPATPAAVTQAGRWVRQRSGTNQSLRGVFFADAQHGWAVGGEGEQDCVITRTTDGKNWSLVGCPYSRRLGAVSFADAANGWAVGDAGTIFRTGDGGATWYPQTSNIGEGITSVKALDANLVYAAIRTGGVLKTTDGGASWRRQDTHADLGLFDIDFIDANNGWASGSNGIVVRTVDGGANWFRLPFNVDVRLYGVDFIDGNVGWVAGNTIWRTNDGGGSWARQSGGEVNKTVEDIHVIDGEQAWGVGDEGMVVRTVDGVHWTREAEGLVGSGLKSVFFLNRDLGWMVGGEGRIFQYSVPVPATWTPVPPTVTPTPTRTNTPTPTATYTPTPTRTPTGPWLSAGETSRRLLIAPGAQRKVGLTYGNIPVPSVLTMTLTGPAFFLANGQTVFGVPIDRASGAYAVVVAAHADGTPGSALTLNGTLAGAHAKRTGVVAWAAWLPAVGR
jgi:photosystem II stability/assembly factor-like uncharacterized protein